MVEIASPRLKHLLSDWEDRRRGREFPCRADFTPFDLKYILGNLSLLDVTYDPLQFRYRLHASNISERMEKDMTNKIVDDLPAAAHVQKARNQFGEVVRSRVPIAFTLSHEFLDHRDPHNCEVLLLPLSNDGTSINMIMSGIVWEDDNEQL
jgi:hypothetical protein